MKIFKNTKKLITALLVSVAIFLSGQIFLSAFSLRAAKADTTTYSDVLEDLSKDKNFNIFDYSVRSLEDYEKLNSDEDESNDIEAISLIQIGEANSGELFLYTYQPINLDMDLTASSVLLSTEKNTSMTTLSFSLDTSTEFKKYSLKCVSSSDVFKKYLVVGFVVESEVFRYYNIVEIERPFNEEIDEKISDETIINFKAHNVAQRWCCYYGDSGLTYERGDLNVARIKPTLTDFLFFEDGITWGSLVGINTGCCAHYIAFNLTNYSADKILDASIDFKTRDVETTIRTDGGVVFFWNLIFGKEIEHVSSTYPSGKEFVPIEKPLFLSNIDTVSHKGNGLFADSYTWNRIMTGNNFLQTFLDQGLEFSESTKNTLNQSQFVFAFYESDACWSKSANLGGETKETLVGTEVADVDIIRIKFMVGKETYNLGVVSDVTSGDNKPGGSNLHLRLEKIYSLIKLIVPLLSLLLIGVFFGPSLAPVITFLFNFLGKLFRLLFKFLWGIITFPFKLFKRSGTKKRKR